MAFDRENLSIVVNNIKSGVVPSTWLYYNEDGDTITAAGYITDYRVKLGDIVDVLAVAYTSTTRYIVSAVSVAGAATLVASANTMVNQAIIQTVSGAGAIDLTNGTTLWITTGAYPTMLVDCVSGQRKIVKSIVNSGAVTLTPSNLSDGSTLTFTEALDVAELQFDGTNWQVIANTGN